MLRALYTDWGTVVHTQTHWTIINHYVGVYSAKFVRSLFMTELLLNSTVLFRYCSASGAAVNVKLQMLSLSKV